MYRDTVSLGVNRAGTYSFVGLNTVPGPPLDDVLAVLPALLSDEEHPPGSHDKGDSSDGEGGGGRGSGSGERKTHCSFNSHHIVIAYLSEVV